MEVREARFEDQLDLDPERLVFLDEIGTKHQMTDRRRMNAAARVSP